MKRRFYELYLEVNRREDLEALVSRIKELGYSGFSLVFRLGKGVKTDLDLVRLAKDLSSKYGIDFILRGEVASKSSSEAKRILRKFRGMFELISVTPINREMTAFSCRDGRIDVITILPSNDVELLRGDLENLKREGKIVELLLRPLRESLKNPSKFYKYFDFYVNTLELLVRKGVKFTLSSGFSSPDEVPDPRSKAALLEVMGINCELSLDALSRFIEDLVERNRLKLKGLIPVRGVEVVT